MSMTNFRKGWFPFWHITRKIAYTILLVLIGMLIFLEYGCEGGKRGKKQTAMLHLQIYSSEPQQNYNTQVVVDDWFIFSKVIEISGLRNGEDNVYISDSRVEQITQGKKFSYEVPAGTYDYINVAILTPEESELNGSTVPSIFIKGRILQGNNLGGEKTFIANIYISKIIKFEEGDNKFKEFEPELAYLALLDLNVNEWVNSVPASVWVDAANRNNNDTLYIDDGSHETIYNLLIQNIGTGATITIKPAP